MRIRTKAEEMRLHSNKAEVSTCTTNVGRGPEGRYLVGFSLTGGELAALHRLLSVSVGSGDDVGEDVSAYLRNALERADIKI